MHSHRAGIMNSAYPANCNKVQPVGILEAASPWQFDLTVHVCVCMCECVWRVYEVPFWLVIAAKYWKSFIKVSALCKVSDRFIVELYIKKKKKDSLSNYIFCCIKFYN